LSGSFTEDFDPSWCSRWTTFGGNWSARNGMLSTVPASPNGAKALAMATAFTNFVYEGDIQVGSVGNAGLIFRVSKPDIGADDYCGYYVGISASDSHIQLGYANNGWHELATATMKFTPNKFYHLKIQALGPHLKVFVDGANQPVMDISDDHFSSGMIGVRDYCTDHDQSYSGYSNLMATESRASAN
jgi:hypothetical protein